MKKAEKIEGSTERGLFRFRKIGDRYLVTNDAGEHIFLEQEDFNLLSGGKLGPGNSNYLDLKAMGAIRDGDVPPMLIEKVKRKN